VSIELPGGDGYGDTKGWDRASIAFHSREPYHPKIGPKDLLLPKGAGRLRELWLCSVCAFCMTILYVWFPLLIVGLFVSLGIWYPGALVAAFVLLTGVLFVVSTNETRALRGLAKEL
jgi:hypothetical protein